jgi:hypothetical protein
VRKRDTYAPHPNAKEAVIAVSVRA